MIPEFLLYNYKAEVTKVYDGDTITVTLDLGMRTFVHGEVIRLARINTPELRGEERPQGLIARDWLRERILGQDVHIKTFRDKNGKYGRYIAEVYYDNICINDELVELGYAEYRSY